MRSLLMMSDSSPERRARTLARIIMAAALIVAASMAVHLFVDAAKHAAPWTNNDNGLILYIAQQMDAGARLYVDWKDPPTLPPIYFFALAAARFSRIAGLPVVLGYDLFVLSIAVAGLFVLLHALRHMRRPWPAIVLACAGYLFFLAKASAVVRDFGQREHVFTLLLVPEVFVVAAGDRVRWRPLWCALLAYFAMIKPQFGAAVLLLELTAPRGAKPRRADLAGFAAGAVAPFVFLWWHSPDSFRAFVADTVRLHVSGAYALMNRSASLLLARGPLIAIAVALVALGALVIVGRRDRSLAGLAVRSGAGVVWALASLVSQQKYFPYHFTPLLGLSVVGGAWAAGECLSERRWPRLADGLAVILVAAGALMFHRDVAANGDPLAVRLGRVLGSDARLIVVSVYSHGLCTPYRGAPRCIGPDSQATWLPQMARAGDADRQIAEWAAGLASQVSRERPEVLALSTSDNALPRGLTPAGILLEQSPIVAPGEYVPLSPTAAAYVQARGWTILRRRDVQERVVSPTAP